MFRIIYLIFAINLLLLSDYSHADKLYKWVDRDGVVHITDKPEEIPEEHSGKIEEIDVERTDYKSMIGSSWKKLIAQKNKIITAIILLVLFIFVYGFIKYIKPRYIERKKTILLKALEKSEIDKMNQEDFKAYIARILRNNGFRILRRQEGSFDPGIALIAEKNKTKYLIQLIPHVESVSRLAVSDADREKHRYGCDMAMVITNYYFAEDAVELANEIGCELVDRVVLAGWIFEGG